MNIRLEILKGAQTLPYIHILADMRLKAFCHFPYLYVGNKNDALLYTDIYSKAPQGLFVIALQDVDVVGIFSGLPLTTPVGFLEEWSQDLAKIGVNVDKCFYGGELIVDPSFQKQGIGSQLIKRFTQEVKAMGFDRIALVTAIRPLNHPLRPPIYFDTDTIWGKYGFRKTPVEFQFCWPTKQLNGTVKEEINKLRCWIAQL